MTPLQLELTRLIGKKELSFGCKLKFRESIITIGNDSGYCIRYGRLAFISGDCDFYPDSETDYEIIGHPATLSDFHRWMNEKGIYFTMSTFQFVYVILDSNYNQIPYYSSKDLLDQEEETLKQIISLIKDNK